VTVYALEDAVAGAGEFRLRVRDCAIEQGRVYAVVGPNGSGKTTLLRMLAFRLRPVRGRVAFRGEVVDYADRAGLLARRRRVSALLQTPYLFNLSVRENIAYGLKVRGLPRREVASRVGAIMERLGLAALAARNAHALSGGEAQRVALARALVLDTEVYLLDEPTANVDQRQVRAVEELILEFNRKNAATIVLSTHSQDQACRLSHHVVSVVEGEIRDIAYENVFAGVLHADPDGLRGMALPGGARIRAATAKTGAATIAVDPRDIILSRQAIDSSALNRLTGTIVKIEDADGTLRVFVDAGALICAMITRRSFLDMGLNVGERVWLTFKATAVKVL